MSNVITEIIGTFVLVLGVLAFFAPSEPDGPLPVGVLGGLIVGLLVLGIGLSLGGPTGLCDQPRA